METLSTEILVVGAGAAGLVCALELAPKSVMVLAKAPPGEGSSSAWAQGGIAAAVGAQDDANQHKKDTIKVSCGLGDEKAAEILCQAGPDIVEKLLGWGVQFDRRDNGALSLSREAAHVHRRVLHAGGDSTGAEIMRALGQSVLKADHVTLKSDLKAFELVKRNDKIVGVLAQNEDGKPVLIEAHAIVMATGGIGQLFGVTTNPLESSGDGLAMAANAGAKLTDLEFVQFHPTSMDIGLTPMPLATEALRGEGAYLIDQYGDRFMKKIHPDFELAPRDVVARAIWSRVKKGQPVFLDCTKSVGMAFKDKFPTVWNYCQKVGLDPAKQPIPIKPAAHYHMGGIDVDLFGRSSLEGLWAVGEVACNKVHGANRLASNSLLDAVVFGHRAAKDILNKSLAKNSAGPVEIPDFDGLEENSKLAEIMYLACGVERSDETLRTGLDKVQTYLVQDAKLDPFFKNRLVVSQMILAMALMRMESRGGHYRADFPHTSDAFSFHNLQTLEEITRFLNGEPKSTKWGNRKTPWPKTQVSS